MLTTVVLHGAAATRFGGPFRLDIRNAAEAVRTLCQQIKGFRQFVEAGEWRVIRGDFQRGVELGETMLQMPVGRVPEIHLVPMPIGSKNGGIGKVLVGVALVAASFAIPGSTPFLAAAGQAVFGFGLSVGLAGVASLIAPSPKVQNYGDRERQKPSALFNGPVNLTEPGAARPLAYGFKVRTGSVVISAGISTEQAALS